MALSKKALQNKAQKIYKNPGRPDMGSPVIQQKIADQKAANKAKNAKPGATPAATAKPAKTPTASDYANQDPDYKRALAGYRANLASAQTQSTANQNDLNSDYTTTRDRLLKQFSTDNSTQAADFANRGMFGSGVYAKTNNDSTTGQTNQLNDAADSYNRNSRQISSDSANATQTELQQEQTAKAAAIQRASAKYGLTGKVGKTAQPKATKPAVTKPKVKK